MYLEKEQPNVKKNMPAGNSSSQLMAYVKSRPLRQQANDKGTDWNIGFGNLKLNHRHLVFDNKHKEVAAKSSTSHEDNIGFHAQSGTKSVEGGKGELFGENVQTFGYKRHRILKNEARAVEAVKKIPVPQYYNIITNNCQDYVASVVNKYETLGGDGL